MHQLVDLKHDTEHKFALQVAENKRLQHHVMCVQLCVGEGITHTQCVAVLSDFLAKDGSYKAATANSGTAGTLGCCGERTWMRRAERAALPNCTRTHTHTRHSSGISSFTTVRRESSSARPCSVHGRGA